MKIKLVILSICHFDEQLAFHLKLGQLIFV